MEIKGPMDTHTLTSVNTLTYTHTEIMAAWMLIKKQKEAN